MAYVNLPRAVTRAASLDINGHSLACAVLDDERRVVLERDVLRMLGFARHSSVTIALLADPQVARVRFMRDDGTAEMGMESSGFVRFCSLIEKAAQAGTWPEGLADVAVKASAALDTLIRVGADRLSAEGGAR